MVAHNAAARSALYRLYRITHADNAAGHFAAVQKDLVRILDRIRHDKGIVRTVLDHAAIAYLAAGLGIERGLIQHQRAAIPGASMSTNSPSAFTIASTLASQAKSV